MLLDLVEQNKYNNFNIKLAHTIGLRSAIYCNELLNILGQVTKKNKFDDNGFFKLDRKYMFNRTTLSVEDQLNIDAALAKINLISKNPNDINSIKLDVDLLCAIVANKDINIAEDLAKRTKIKTSTEVKETKKQAIINALKDSIVCSNYELLTALRNWVDSMYETGKVLSKASVAAFQKTLNEYTKGDLDLALRLVQIATIRAYRDCAWAINVYEKDLSYKAEAAKNNILVRTIDDNIAKSEDLSSIGY